MQLVSYLLSKYNIKDKNIIISMNILSIVLDNKSFKYTRIKIILAIIITMEIIN